MPLARQPAARAVAPARGALVCALLAVVGTALLTATALPAAAHEGNVGLSEITVEEDAVRYRLYLDVRHLPSVLTVTEDADVVVDDARDGHGLGVRAGDLTALVAEHVTVTADGVAAGPVLERLRVVRNTDLTHLGGVALMGDFSLLEADLRFPFDAPVRDWRVDYDLFFPEPAAEPHSNLAWVHDDGTTGTHIFSPDAASLRSGQAVPVAGASGGGTATVGVAAAGVAAVLAAAAIVLLVRRRSPRAASSAVGPVRGPARHSP